MVATQRLFPILRFTVLIEKKWFCQIWRTLGRTDTSRRNNIFYYAVALAIKEAKMRRL